MLKYIPNFLYSLLRQDRIKKTLPVLLAIATGISITCQRYYDIKSYRNYSRVSFIDFLPADDTAVNNLLILGKVWGFVKYYHPVFRDSAINIDYELFELIPQIIRAGYETRNRILCEWIDSLGTFRTDEAAYRLLVSDTAVKQLPSYEWIYDPACISPGLSARLTRLIYATRNYSNIYSAIPIEDNIERWDQRFRNEKAYKNITHPDTGYRLLALFRYWNMIEYFYPYKHFLKKDWDEILKEYIPLFINSRFRFQYFRTCYRLFTEIEDTHANEFYPYRLYGTRLLPVRFQYAEEKFVIMKSYLPDSNLLRRGDIVLSIDGIYMDSLAKNFRRYTSCSNEGAFYREAAKYMQMTEQDSVEITCQRNGREITSKLASLYVSGPERYRIQYEFPYDHPAYGYINDSTGYICVAGYSREMEKDIVKMLGHVNNLIIDIRSNAGGRPFLQFAGKYLVTEHYGFIKWYRPADLFPGAFTIEKNKLRYGKNKKVYSGKTVLLVNERTQSSYEFLTLYLQTLPQTSTIGSITAGAGGEVAFLNLPGGIGTAFTSSGFHTPSGFPVQRQGVPLDEEIPVTIRAIREGRDEVFERAVELISKL